MEIREREKERDERIKGGWEEERDKTIKERWDKERDRLIKGIRDAERDKTVKGLWDNDSDVVVKWLNLEMKKHLATEFAEIRALKMAVKFQLWSCCVDFVCSSFTLYAVWCCDVQ